MSEKIDDSDLRVDLVPMDEPGGQKVGTGRFNVRVTHIPTGMSATVSDRRGQHRARNFAMTVVQMMVDDFG